MYKFISLALLLCLTYLASAQNGKIINKDFDGEAFDQLEFDLYGETVYEPWEADYVLVETTVKVWDTPKRLFDNHILKGRYYCHIKSTNTDAKISSIPVERNKLAVRESVVSVVYYPSNFVLSDSKLIRQGEAVTAKEE